MTLRPILAALVSAGLALSASPTLAQQSSFCEKDWHGEMNEFGRVCMKFQGSMAGEAIPVEARFWIYKLYENRDTSYFLFMLGSELSPFRVSGARLATADGKDLPLYKMEGADGDKAIKFFVDVQDMPASGTEIVLSGRVDSCDRGMYQVGALVQPFNYRWQRVVMGNGEPADLYGFTQIGVNDASCRGGIPGIPKLDVPAPGALAALAATGAVAVGLARRRGA